MGLFSEVWCNLGYSWYNSKNDLSDIDTRSRWLLCNHYWGWKGRGAVSEIYNRWEMRKMGGKVEIRTATFFHSINRGLCWWCHQHAGTLTAISMQIIGISCWNLFSSVIPLCHWSKLFWLISIVVKSS